jgi:uncharacterized protein YkwD
MDILSTLFASLPSFQGGFNFLDLIILCIVLFYVHEGYTLGFTLATLDLISFIISFVAALQFYTNVAWFFTTFFALPIGIANAAGFFLIAFVSEIVLTIVTRKGLKFLPGLPPNRFSHVLKGANHWLGIFPGLISAFIILSFLLSVIVTFPSSPVIKNAVNTSNIGSKLVENTSLFEKQLDTLFGGALNETLNFLTVEPESDKTVTLHFKVENGSVDAKAEQEMFKLVNTERAKAGLDLLAFDNELRDVARDHSDDMFTRGYFSHQSPEGLSPFDRMEDAGIVFGYAGENLALAPSTTLAMQGLMNSPGHRANILSPNFKKIGIGVIDGGIYGKMYSQEFSD